MNMMKIYQVLCKLRKEEFEKKNILRLLINNDISTNQKDILKETQNQDKTFLITQLINLMR